MVKRCRPKGTIFHQSGSVLPAAAVPLSVSTTLAVPGGRVHSLRYRFQR